MFKSFLATSVPLCLAASGLALGGCGGSGTPQPGPVLSANATGGGTGGVSTASITTGGLVSGLTTGSQTGFSTGGLNSGLTGIPPPPTLTGGGTSGGTTCAVPAGSYAGVGPGTRAGGPGDAVLPPGVQEIDLVTDDLVYDPVAHRIYASVPSRAGSGGNSITAIDPVTGTLGPAVFIGSEPNKLALTDNSQYLYVGLDGAGAVRRFDLASLSPGPQFSLGIDPFFGPRLAGDIQAQPGSSQTIAVSCRFPGLSPAFAGLFLYDNGVPRSASEQRSPAIMAQIKFSASGQRIYGYDDEDTGFDLSRAAVAPCGIAFIDSTGNLITGFGASIALDNGLLYGSTGQVVDPESRSLVGRYVLPQSSMSLVAPDSRNDRTFFLASSPFGGSTVLLAFDQRTFLPLASVSLPTDSGIPGSLIRVGANGLAYRTDAGHVFIVAPLPGT